MKARRRHLQQDFEHLEEQLREANEEINRRSGRPLIPAIISGLILGGAAITGFFVPIVFAIFVMAIVGGASWELATAVRSSGRRVPRIPTVIASAVIVGVAYFFGAWFWFSFLAGAVVLTVWRLVELAAPRHRATARVVLGDILGAIFVLTYVPFLASFAVLLFIEDRWWVLAFLIVVVLIDTAAYAVGLTLGRHPMAPRISPKKSWEGFGGGAAIALGSGVAVAMLLMGQPWWMGLILGVLMLFTATFGDLAESLIKRDLGIKDMSGLLPGHGGLLDRLDGILLSAPVAYGLFLVVGDLGLIA